MYETEASPLNYLQTRHIEIISKFDMLSTSGADEQSRYLIRTVLKKLFFVERTRTTMCFQQSILVHANYSVIIRLLQM